MSTATATRTASKDAAKTSEQPPPAQPYAVVDVETQMVPAYRGRVQIVTPQAEGEPKTEIVECPHARYGHESETAALKCAKAEAARRGLKVAAK